MVEKVKSKIKLAFLHFASKDGINMKDVRVRIVSDKDSMDFTLMNKSSLIRKTKLSEIIGNSMEALLVKPYLQKAIKKIVHENGVENQDWNIKIYPLPDNSPSAYLYCNGKAFKPINIDELIN